MSSKKKMFHLMGLSLIAYPLGLLNQILMSNYFGTSAEIDAYWIGITIVNMLGFYVHPAREALVPEFFKRRKENKILGNQYFSEVGNFLLIIVLISSVLLLLFPDFFTRLIVNDQQEKLCSRVSSILPYIAPLVFLIALTEILNGILISYNKVIFQNLGRIIGALASIAFLIMFAKQWQIKSVIFAAVFAQLILFIIQGRELRKAGLKYNLFSHPKTDSQFRRMTGALLLSYAFSQLYSIFERNTFTFFGEGVVSAYQYAFALGQIPQNIFIVTLATALWPKFMKLAQQKDYDELYSLTSIACKRLVLILSFVTLFSWIFSKDIVYLLFYRGAFNEESLRLTTMSFRAIILVLCPLGAWMVMARVLVSLQKSKMLVFIGFGNVIGGSIFLVVGRYIGELEIAVFHYLGNVLLGSFIALFAFFRVTNRSLFDRKMLLNSIWWCSRLLFIIVLFYLLYVRVQIETISKTLIILRLIGHLTLLSIAFLGSVILVKLLPYSDMRLLFLDVRKRIHTVRQK